MPRRRRRTSALGVADKEAARQGLKAIGAEIEPGRFLNAHNPFGNLIQDERAAYVRAGRVAALGLDIVGHLGVRGSAAAERSPTGAIAPRCR
jgi:hypothetical protein